MSSRKLFIVGGVATNILFRDPRGLWDRITKGQNPKSLPDKFLTTERAQALISAGQLIEVSPKKKGEAATASPPPKKKKGKR